jgi:hypothetical protein
VNNPLRLYGAQLAANLTVSGGTLSNPGKIALNLDRATIGVFRGDHFAAEGQVSLIGARIASDIALENSHFTGDREHPPLVADRASIDGALILTSSRAYGEISLRTVRVGQRILLSHSQLDNLGGTALRLSRAQVAADVFCDGMTAAGRIRVAPGRGVSAALAEMERELAGLWVQLARCEETPSRPGPQALAGVVPCMGRSYHPLRMMYARRVRADGGSAGSG